LTLSYWCHSGVVNYVSIPKRGAKWYVQIRHLGFLNLSKIFILKPDAEKWCKVTEAALDRGEISHSRSAKNIILSYLLNKYRDERLKSVIGSTVAREPGVLDQAFQIVINEWQVPIDNNPISKVRSPALNKARKRRLKDYEYHNLIEACAVSINPWLVPIVKIAV
jgi:hypothetical protein